MNEVDSFGIINPFIETFEQIKSYLMSVHFTLLFWFWLWLDVLLSGINRFLLIAAVSVSPLIWTVAFVCVSILLRVIVTLRRIRVCLREVRHLLVSAWTSVTRVVRVSVTARVPVRRLYVSVTGGISVRLIWKLLAVWGVSGWRVHGVALTGRVGVRYVFLVTPTRWGRVPRRLWGWMALGLRKADSGCFLVKGQRAVAVLAGENRGGATVARLIGRLALDGDVWMAPSRIVGFEEGAVYETRADWKTRISRLYCCNIWLKSISIKVDKKKPLPPLSISQRFWLPMGSCCLITPTRSPSCIETSRSWAALKFLSAW